LLTIDNLNKQLPEFNPLNSTSKDSKIYKKVRVKTYDIIIIKIENCYCNINVFYRFYLFNKSNGLQFTMFLFLRFLG
jgi:competence protein ComGF